MMDHKYIRQGARIELYDEETKTWVQLTIVKVTESSGNVECKMLSGEAIFTTTTALMTGARPRPYDGHCADCGCEAHEGACEERRCSECNAEVTGRCLHHPMQPVHVYRRVRYLAEILDDKPYPTQQTCEALRRDLVEQMQTLRNAEQPRASRVMITVTQRAEILSALDNAATLIESLPGDKRRRA